MNKLEQMLSCCENEMRRSYRKRRAIADQGSSIGEQDAARRQTKD
jgi:hypothetical protein